MVDLSICRYRYLYIRCIPIKYDNYQTMSSMILWGFDRPLEMADIKPSLPSEGEVFVKLRMASLNKRDYWITKGKYPGIVFPLVLGSDGAGTVDGREVIINPGLDWGSDPDHFSPDFRILGMPDFGTLAHTVKVPEINLHDKPAHLSWEEAAALPLCGVTAYRAMMTRGRAKTVERMLVTGIGGGVASMAMLFGIALGMDVWVTSSSDHKIDMAVNNGASGGVNYTRHTWDVELAEKAKGRFDLVIDGAGGSDFSKIMQMMNPRGRIVIYGGTRGKIDDLSPQRIFWKQMDILGSTMGSPEDFNNMLDFVNKHQIKPIISHTFSLEQANEALAVIADSDQFGKICIDIPGS